MWSGLSAAFVAAGGDVRQIKHISAHGFITDIIGVDWAVIMQYVFVILPLGGHLIRVACRKIHTT
jgi:hypothetical protein